MNAADELERMADEFRKKRDSHNESAERHKRDPDGLGWQTQHEVVADAWGAAAAQLRARAAELRAAPAEPALPLDTTDPGSVWVRFGKPFIIAKTSYFQGVAWAHFDGLREAFEFGELTAENGWRYVGRVEAK